MTESVFQRAIIQLEYKTHELLGIIGSSGQNIIDYFSIDDKAEVSTSHCKPCPLLISTLKNISGIYFVGILHSHPPCLQKLSDKDIQYAHSIILSSKGLPFILMGIICDKKIFMYQVDLEKTIPLDLLIIKEPLFSKE